MALVEKGVLWTSVFVNIGPAFEQYEPWYVQLNPRMVVPTLTIVEHTIPQRVLTDSASILQAIDADFSGPSLVPQDDLSRHRMHSWLDRQDQLRLREFSYARQPGLTGVALRYSLGLRRKRLLKQRKRNPNHAAVYDQKLADLARWREAVEDDDGIAKIQLQIQNALDAMDRSLVDHDFLAGDHYSLADLSWTAVFGRLEHLGYASWWTDERPQLSRWLKAMKARPSHAQATNTLTPWQGLQLVARVIMPKIFVVWLIKIAIFWLVAEAISSL